MDATRKILGFAGLRVTGGAAAGGGGAKL